MQYRGWMIEETACYPCSWKIHDPKYASDNATWRYHETVKEAMATIDRRQFTSDAVIAPSLVAGAGTRG